MYLKKPIKNPIIIPVITFQSIILAILASGENKEVLQIIVSIYPKCHIPNNIVDTIYAIKSFFIELISLNTNPLKINSSNTTVIIALYISDNILYNSFLKEGLDPSEAYIKALLAQEEFIQTGIAVSE